MNGFPGRIDVGMCLQRGHLRNNPHLVVKIFLTYKSVSPILPTTKSKFLSIVASFDEACPNVVLEAMACGKVVIASNVGGIPELIEDGVTGLLFRSGDYLDLSEKMYYVMTHEELEYKIGSTARLKITSKLSIDNFLYNIVSQIRSLA